MRKSSILVLSLVSLLAACRERSAAGAVAKCPQAYLQVSPAPSQRLPPLPALLVSGYRESRKALLDLREGSTVLQGAAAPIPLRMLKRLDVSENRAVLLLAATRPLSAGASYSLAGLPANAPQVAWTANETPGAAPVWQGPPELVRLRSDRNEGAVVEAILRLPLGGDVLAAQVEVKDAEGRTVLSDLQPLEAQQVAVSSGGCGGPLQFHQTGRYDVTVWPIDLAGHPGEPRSLSFTLSSLP